MLVTQDSMLSSGGISE